MIQLRDQARWMMQGLRQRLDHGHYLQLRRRFLIANTIDKPSWCITCQGKIDGGGSQWHACITVLALAQHLGLNYRHTPFSQIEHGPIDQQAWLSAWNSLFRLDEFILTKNGQPHVHCASPLAVAQGILRQPCSSESVVVLEHAHALTNWQPMLIANLRPFLRLAYNPSPSLASPPSPLSQTLVIHVRRGDVQPIGPHQHRYTMAKVIAARSRHLQQRYPWLRYVLLLSSSADDDLLALRDQGFLLDTEHDVFTHFHWMGQGAGLLMAKSSLSYLAALLNPNLVIYEPFEHPPLSDWIALPTR